MDADRTPEATQHVVCDLSSTDRAAQEFEWSDLVGSALSAERVPKGVATTFPLDLADDVEALAAREGACCGSWLTIATERAASHIRLVLTTDSAEGRDMIEAMVGMANR